MPRVFVRREAGNPYVIQAGDTLTTIATRCPPAENISWQELALFNWATADSREVNRALIEQFGCRENEIDWANPQNTVIRPTVPSPVIRLPRLFAEILLPLNTTYTVKVKEPMPAPAIRFDVLDKWFRPGHENCDVQYSLEGVLPRANILDLDVYASNYCQVVAKDKGDFQTFSFKPLDIPIRRITVAGQTQRVQQNPLLWAGDTDATKGVLAQRGNATRYVNVAQSPYTMLLRYYKNAADRDARVDLFPFWPEFQSSTVATPKSLEFRWKVVGTSKLQYGQLLVFDTHPNDANRLIYRKALRPADLTEGEHTFQWDGVRNDGQQIRRNRAPYRMELQAHSGVDEEEGLAFAARHTEVRLFSHQDLGSNVDPVADTQCLAFQVAPEWPGPPLDADSTKWMQQKLAQCGYHPGPIDGKTSRKDFKVSLTEFQRSHANNAAAPFARLAMDGSLGSESKGAITRAVVDERPLFGDPANYADLARAAATTRITDKTSSLVLWVDDRHVYTELDQKPPSPLHQMNDYRAGMEIGDERVNKDKESTPRPWIPLSCSPAVLSKADPLYPNAPMPTLAAFPRMAETIGPIRLDWNFDELAQADVLAGIFVGGDAAAKSRTRTKTYLERVTGADGVGVRDGAKIYTNSPEYLEAVPAAKVGENTDASIETQINRLEITINAVNYAVAFPTRNSLSLASAIAEINNVIGVNGTASDANGELLIETANIGVGANVRVGPGSSKVLLRQFDFKETAGTAAAPGKLKSSGLGALQTADPVRLRLRVDGKAVEVTLTASRNLNKATVVTEINTALTNAGVSARARLDDANRVILESNGFGDHRAIDVRASSSTRLLTELGLAAGETRGTATTAASVATAAKATINTGPIHLLVLRINGIRVDVRFTKDEALKKQKAAEEISAACATLGVKAKALFDKDTGVLRIETLEPGVNQTIRVTTASNAILLTRLGLVAGTHTGTAALSAFVSATNTDATVDTADPTRLHLHVDGKAVTAILPAEDALPIAQAAKRIHAALQEAGIAAQATETGNVITIATTGTGKNRTIKIRRTSSRILLEQLGAPTGVTRGSDGPTFCGGIRPKDLDSYYKAPFGFDTDASLLPWLAQDDGSKKCIATIVHDDLGQDAEKLFDDSRGSAGLYFRPSRIAGDGYRLSAAVSFAPMPDGSEHPNWAVLRARYPKPPVGHTAKMMNWRKASVRGYVGWTSAPAAPPAPDAAAAAVYYRDGHVHFINEGIAPFGVQTLQSYAVPTPALPAPQNSAITAADFANIATKRLDVKKSSFRSITPRLAPGYVWPYLHEAHYGIRPRRVPMNEYKDWLGDLENWSWDLINEEILQRMIFNIERNTARMRGHLLVEFTSSPDLELRQYECDTCDFIATYVVNQPFVNGVFSAGVNLPMANGAACPVGCGGTLTMSNAVYNNGLPLSAIGLGMGASWLYQPRVVETWAHELGHHRHLEHAQAQSGASPDGAPGYQLAQHDIAGNPAYAVAAQWHQRAWDRHCLMSYDKSQPRRFCGKCALRQRGWAVENLANAPGNLQDP